MLNIIIYSHANRYIMTEKYGLTWYQDVIMSVLFLGSAFLASYLTKDNQTPEVTAGVYLAGVVFGIINELNIPIKYIGIGEKIDDIKEFDIKEFVDSII